MRRILDSGNEIANHSMHHEGPSAGSLAQTNRLILRATGFRPACSGRPAARSTALCSAGPPRNASAPSPGTSTPRLVPADGGQSRGT